MRGLPGFESPRCVSFARQTGSEIFAFFPTSWGRKVWNGHRSVRAFLFVLGCLGSGSKLKAQGMQRGTKEPLSRPASLETLKIPHT